MRKTAKRVDRRQWLVAVLSAISGCLAAEAVMAAPVVKTQATGAGTAAVVGGTSADSRYISWYSFPVTEGEQGKLVLWDTTSASVIEQLLPGTEYIRVRGISNSGTVVGHSFASYSGASSQGFSWNAGSDLTRYLTRSFSGGTYAITPDGSLTVGGRSELSGLAYTVAAGSSTAVTSSDTSRYVYTGVSDNGQVMTAVKSNRSLVRLSGGTEQVILPDLGPNFAISNGYFLSADGSVVAGSASLTNYYAYRWTAAGGLKTYADPNIQAVGISPDGKFLAAFDGMTAAVVDFRYGYNKFAVSDYLAAAGVSLPGTIVSLYGVSSNADTLSGVGELSNGSRYIFQVSGLDFAAAAPAAIHVASPSSTSTTVSAAGVAWFSFDYAGGDVTLDTLGSILDSTPSDDTEIALYDALGHLVGSNDDIDLEGGLYASRLSFANGELPAGTYYVAVAGFDATFNPYFSATTTGLGGVLQLNLSVVPEPGLIAPMAMAGALLLRRTRRHG